MDIEIEFTKRFERGYEKLSPKQKDRAKERLALFQKNRFSPLLKSHKLARASDLKNHRSVWINGDIRAIYKIKNGKAIFTHIGTHAELYE